MSADTVKRVITAEKNDAGRFDCPLPDCKHKGPEGLASPAGLAAHVRNNHRPLWDRLYKKAHGEYPASSPKAATNGTPKKKRSHAGELVGARYSARPRIDRKMEAAAHENNLATMEAACEVMALPTVRQLRPHNAVALFKALLNAHERQAATNPA